MTTMYYSTRATRARNRRQYAQWAGAAIFAYTVAYVAWVTICTSVQ